MSLTTARDNGPCIQSNSMSSETTPLLETGSAGTASVRSVGSAASAQPARLYRRLRVAFLVVAAASAACLLSYLLLANLDASVKAAVHTRIDSVSLVGFNAHGIDCQIKGSIYIDYDAIPAARVVQRAVLKAVAALWGAGVVIRPVDRIDIAIRPPPEPDFIPFLQVEVPPLAVDVLNGHHTQIDVVTTSQINLANFIKYLRYLTLLERFELNAKFNADVVTPWFIVGNRSVDYYTLVEVDQAGVALDVKSFNVERNGDALVYHSQLEVNTTLPIELTLEPMEWVLLVAGCAKAFIQLSQFVTGPLAIKALQPVSVVLNGSVTQLSPALTANCSGSSIIDQLASQYLGGQGLLVYVSAAATDPSIAATALPPWLIELMLRLHVPVKVMHIPLPPPQSQLQNVTYHSVDVASRGDGQFMVNAVMLAAVVFVPSILADTNWQVPVCQVDCTVSHEGQVVATARSLKEHTISVSWDGDVANVTIALHDLDLSITDHMADLVHRFLLHEHVKLCADVTRFSGSLVAEPLLPEPARIGNVALGEFYFEVSSSSDLDEVILANVAALSIAQIRVVGSTTNRLDLEMSLAMELALAVNVALIIDRIGYDVVYDTKRIVSFAISNINSINQLMSLPLAVSIHHNENNVVELQGVISKFLSLSDSDDTQIVFDLVNGDTRIDESPQLARLLSGIDILNVTLPELEFERSSARTMSPFLVDATIYILKSEIEITIYNPLSNCNIMAQIVSARATYDDAELGYIGRQHMEVTPGIYTLPRIPFKTNSKLGSDILRRALNNQLKIEIAAVFDVQLKGHAFPELQLMYKGSGLKTNIKL